MHKHHFMLKSWHVFTAGLGPSLSAFPSREREAEGEGGGSRDFFPGPLCQSKALSTSGCLCHWSAHLDVCAIGLREV